MTEPCAQDKRISTIETSVREINSDLTDIKSDIAVIKDRMGNVLDKVEDHEHVLRGSNGYSGIISSIEQSNTKLNRIDAAMFEDGGLSDTMKRVSDLVTRQERENKEKSSEKKDNIKWLWRLVAGSAVTAVLGWLYVLLNLK